MMIEVLVAIVGIAGVLLGVMAQYLCARRTETARHFQELRTQSCVDFVKATAAMAIAQKKQDVEKESDATLMTEAKVRIAIYGSPDVVASMAEFFRKYGVLTSPGAFRSFIAIVSAMRADASGDRGAIPSIDIGQLILSKDVE